MPDAMKSHMNEKFTLAIKEYSDFACCFSHIVEMWMIGLVNVSKNEQSDGIVPGDYLDLVKDMLIPVTPEIPEEAESQAEYSKLFSLQHLQILSTLKFGKFGIQSTTNDSHPLWLDLNERIRMDNQDNNGGLEQVLSIGKAVNTKIKNAAVAQFATNMENMYANNSIFFKALDRLLLVLLKVNLQQHKEKERMKYVDKPANKKETGKSQTLTRNKKRSLIKNYHKQIKKYKDKKEQEKVKRLEEKILYIKSLDISRKVRMVIKYMQTYF